MNLILRSIKKITRISMLSILIFSLLSPLTSASGVDFGTTVFGNNRATGNSALNQGTLRDSIDQTQVNSFLYGDDVKVCFLADRDADIYNNLDNRNFVPVTSDILEDESVRIRRNTDWVVFNECLYKKSAALIRQQFIAKHVSDIKAGINHTLMSGNSVYGPGYNTLFQNVSDRIVDSVIYNEANIENACSPFKQTLKQYINKVFADENIGRSDYLIKDLTCSLASDSGGNHESSFSIYNDPSVASWNSWYAGPNLIKDALNLESGINKARAVGEENVRIDQRDGQGTQSLYRCYGEDGDNRRGSLSGAENKYYRQALDGQYCEKITSGNAINNEYTSTLSLEKNTILNARDAFTTFPKLMAAQIAGIRGSAFDAHAGVAGIAALQNIQEAFAQDMNAVGVESVLVGQTLADDLFNTIIKLFIGKIIEALSGSIEIGKEAAAKIEILTECLAAHEGQTAPTFDPEFAIGVADNVLAQIVELTLKVEEYQAVVDEKESQINALILELALGGNSNISEITRQIKELRKEIKDHSLAGIAGELEAYIGEHVASGNPDSIGTLTEACLSAEWDEGGAGGEEQGAE